MIVGGVQSSSGNYAVIWTSSGMINLNTAYANRIPNGWKLVTVNAISADGRFVAGDAIFNLTNRGYVLDLAP